MTQKQIHFSADALGVLKYLGSQIWKIHKKIHKVLEICEACEGGRERRKSDAPLNLCNLAEWQEQDRTDLQGLLSKYPFSTTYQPCGTPGKVLDIFDLLVSSTMK